MRINDLENLKLYTIAHILVLAAIIALRNLIFLIEHMRNWLVFSSVFISMLFFGYCKSNKIDIHNTLIGNWELRKETGGLKNTSTSFKPGNIIFLMFEKTRYHEFSNGQLASMGRYRIINDTMKLSGQISNRLVFKPEVYPEDTARFFIDFNKNQLVVTEDKVGGVTRFYERIK